MPKVLHSHIMEDQKADMELWNFTTGNCKLAVTFFKTPPAEFAAVPGETYSRDGATWKNFEARTPQGLIIEITAFLDNIAPADGKEQSK